MLLVTTTEVTDEEVGVMQRIVHSDGLGDEEAEVLESAMNGDGLRDEEAVVVESVISSDLFREELQEMVAKQISDSLQPSSQPLYDLISLRQRYGQPDVNRKYGTWHLLKAVCLKVIATLTAILWTDFVHEVHLAKTPSLIYRLARCITAN